MKKIASFLITTLGAFGLLLTVPEAAHATSACNISGALQATWGCGRVLSASYYLGVPGSLYSGYSTRIQDKLSDGSCVYIYVHTVANNTWSYTGDRECNEVATTFNRSNLPAFDGIRIYRFSSQGNNYLTLF